ncbi:hypothetical protein C4D60_Mb08t33950 [Musa balbisiana]|uniref:Uncharacterized protein n=1 Tax=Musa balbisiana TaxID=52838 RepID=A0A4V4H9E8_MUSBA|nr:hypothetical protein C4D60_Mb08t33950 [Musa balbisiana]
MLPLSPNLSSDEKVARALEALMWTHDLDSIVSESSLGNLQERYSILEDYVLLAPKPGQRAYDPIPKGFAVTLDSLETGLRFPLHPVISSCISWGWSFGLRRSACMIDNTAPVLNDDEQRDFRRLKEILPASRVIQNMTEQWLVEAGLSPTPREMVNLRSVRRGRTSLVSSLHPPIEPRIGSKDAPVEVEASRPRKKAKICVTKGSDVAAGQSGGTATEPTDHAGRSLGLVRATGDLLEGEASDPLVARWGGLSRGEWVWADEDSAALFIRGGFHPDMARELYTSSSEVLLGKSAKSLLWGQHYTMALMDRVRDAGRVIGNLSERNAELLRQIEEIRVGAALKAVAAAEQHASDLEAEATHLKSELKVAEERNKELQVYLKATQAEVRLAKGEMLALNQKLDEAHAASGAMANEICQWPEKDKKLIEANKKSSGFELGLTRTGQVTNEYGYQVALARFRARYLDLEVHHAGATPQLWVHLGRSADPLTFDPPSSAKLLVSTSLCRGLGANTARFGSE